MNLRDSLALVADEAPRMLVEIDGPGVSPDTIDPLLLLDLAAAVVSLIRGNADAMSMSLGMKGLRIVRKCAAVELDVEKFDAAQVCAQRALRQIEGHEEAPRGYADWVKRARTALERLPEGYSAQVTAGNWGKSIVVPSPPVEPLDELIAIRAEPILAGGDKTRTVQFRSSIEGKFTLRTTESIVLELGGALYRDVDIEARVSRNEDGEITGGDLVKYWKLDQGDAEALWQNWYKRVTQEPEGHS